jgi:molecular chaperone GrpE
MAEKTVLEDFETGEVIAQEGDIIAKDIDLNKLKTPEVVSAKKPPKKDGHKSVELEKKVKELETELLLRRAEFANYRKRVEQEKLDMSRFASEKLILEILPIMDSFDRALHPANIAEEHKPIYEGFALVQKLIVDTLAKQGVAEIRSIHEKFNPLFHQAVSKEQQDGVEPGIVVKEYQKGYMLSSRVLRPSMVVVTE